MLLLISLDNLTNSKSAEVGRVKGGGKKTIIFPLNKYQYVPVLKGGR